MPRQSQLLSRWTLPRIVNPPRSRRYVICVPDEQFYRAAFEGLLIELTYSKNWQRDADHTAAIVSRVWEQALLNMSCEAVPPTPGIQESDYEMSICEQLRFQNGKLQGFCCGEWVDIDGQEGVPPGGGDQPGGGTEQPPSGGCATYKAKMAANNKWYLPTVVSAGDTIAVTSADGAGNDGTLSPWRCPTGDTFFAGGCIGGTAGPSGGDPASAADHMEIVANIGGTWYRPLGGMITVPGGVSSAEVFFQVNDSDITDNAGSYTFSVEVCNNQAVINSHTFNFALSDGGFTVEANGGDPGGEYVIGVGWKPTIETGASHWYELFISKTFASLDITAITAFYTASWTTNTEPGSYALDTNGTGISASKSPDQGTAVSFGAVGDAPATTKIKVDFNVGKTVSGHLSGQDFVLTSLVVQFYGPDPF